MTDNLWECPSCGAMMTQPAPVKEVVHHCSEKSSKTASLVLVQAVAPAGDVKVIVSGVSYRATGGEIPGCQNPTIRQVGRGRQYIYNVSRDVASQVELHLRALAESATPDEAYSLTFDADRIAAL